MYAWRRVLHVSLEEHKPDRVRRPDIPRDVVHFAPELLAEKHVMPAWLSGVSALSGFLLAICVFLPAVEACNKPVYPFEMPAVWAPYVLGLLTALVMLVRHPRGLGRVLEIAHLVGAAGLMLFIGWGVHAEALDRGHLRAREVVLIVLFWPLAMLALRAFGKNRTPRWRTARATGASGALALLWFAPFALHRPLVGLWVSIASSAMLLFAGFAQELWLARTRTRPIVRPTVF